MTIETAHKPGGSRAWFIWLLAALAFGYAFFHRVAPSVMVADLMREFAIGGAVLGVLSALYFYPYFLLQVPLGALLERIGARYLLAAALTVAALGSAMFAMADSIYTAYAGRILIGVGSSVGFLGGLSLAFNWFPPNRLAFLAGLAMFCAMISGMIAQAPLAFFVGAFGWRTSMWLLGGVGLLLAALIVTFVRNQPEGSKPQQSERRPWSDVWRGLMQALSMWEVWKIALVAAAMSGPMLTFGALWGTPYLQVAYSLSQPQAAFFISLILLGWAIGAPFWGWFSDFIGKRRILLVAGCLVMNAAIALLVAVAGLPLWVTAISLALMGFTGAAMSITFSLVRDSVPDEIGGAATGIVNSLTVGSGALLQPIVGLALDRLWDGRISEGARVYQAADFRTAFLFVLASTLIGLVLAILLKKPE
ncbi:MAG: MFS transporter [Pseudomonadota bacterium]